MSEPKLHMPQSLLEQAQHVKRYDLVIITLICMLQKHHNDTTESWVERQHSSFPSHAEINVASQTRPKGYLAKEEP